MIGLLELAVFGFLGLTLIYWLVVVYSRSVRSEKLEREWDTDPAREGASGPDRAAFIADGLRDYHTSLRRRLIVLVYVLPLLAFGVTIYLVNHQ